MGRDLLYKPNIPTVLPDEDSGTAKKVKKKGKAATARELGQVGSGIEVRPTTGPAKPAAYKAAYFNKDISGVGRVNLNQSNAKALRGDDGITDLRKVVLPPSVMGIAHPEPGVLRGAMDLMGLDSAFAETLEGLLNRQGAWAKGQGVTIEMLEERLAQLEAMVEARKIALGRMAEGRSQQPVTSVTVLHAAQVAGNGMDGMDDLAGAGTELIKKTADQANAMHKRIAKMLGVKVE